MKLGKVWAGTELLNDGSRNIQNVHDQTIDEGSIRESKVVVSCALGVSWQILERQSTTFLSSLPPSKSSIVAARLANMIKFKPSFNPFQNSIVSLPPNIPSSLTNAFL